MFSCSIGWKTGEQGCYGAHADLGWRLGEIEPELMKHGLIRCMKWVTMLGTKEKRIHDGKRTRTMVLVLTLR